jgi:hypothetical protein
MHATIIDALLSAVDFQGGVLGTREDAKVISLVREELAEVA